MLMRLQHKRPDGEVDTYHLKPGRKYYFGRGSTCELRILDLKLSRKHCLLEWINGTWQVEDLGSTNGAKLNGARLANARNLTAGAVIEAGTTTLTIAGFIDPTQDPNDDDDSAARLRAVEQLPLPAEKSDEAPLAESTLMANDWDPTGDEVHASTGALQPLSNGAAKPPVPIEAAAPRPALGIDDPDSGNATVAPGTFIAETTPLSPKHGATTAADSDALVKPTQPSPSPTRSTRIKPITIRVGKIDGDDVAEVHPAAPELELLQTPADTAESAPAPAAPVQPVVVRGPAPSTPATDSQERTFFITVLGRRVGPLTRADARDLKARELKGVLTTADLDSYPQA